MHCGAAACVPSPGGHRFYLEILSGPPRAMRRLALLSGPRPHERGDELRRVHTDDMLRLSTLFVRRRAPTTFFPGRRRVRVPIGLSAGLAPRRTSLTHGVAVTWPEERTSLADRATDFACSNDVAWPSAPFTRGRIERARSRLEVHHCNGTHAIFARRDVSRSMHGAATTHS